MATSLLFVCLGNICRSPLAEAAFRAEAERLGLDVAVDSAGTGDWHVGEPPDRRAIAVAAESTATSSPSRSASARKAASARGERQILPRQTNSRLVAIAVARQPRDTTPQPIRSPELPDGSVR